MVNLHIDGSDANGDVMVWEHFGASNRGAPADVPVLAPAEVTTALTVIGGDQSTARTELVTFTFTDARGSRWRRVGSGQPELVMGDDD